MMFKNASSFLVGIVAAAFIPTDAFTNASSEIASFVSLLMAGLLPAMILTATVLRGDQFTVARIRAYSEALKDQLAFWAMLFLMALVSGFGLVSLKMFSAPVSPEIASGLAKYAPFLLSPVLNMIARHAGTSLCAGGIAVILANLWPAYLGLRSILNLSVQMAEVQALANDRSLKASLDSKEQRLKGRKQPSKAEWSTDEKN